MKIGGAEEMKELARTVQNFLNSLQSEYHEFDELPRGTRAQRGSQNSGVLPLRHGR